MVRFCCPKSINLKLLLQVEEGVKIETINEKKVRPYVTMVEFILLYRLDAWILT